MGRLSLNPGGNFERLEKKSGVPEMINALATKNYRAVYEVAATSLTITGALQRDADHKYRLTINAAAAKAALGPIYPTEITPNEPASIQQPVPSESSQAPSTEPLISQDGTINLEAARQAVTDTHEFPLGA